MEKIAGGYLRPTSQYNSIKPELILGIVMCGSLDESLKMGYGDVYEDLDVKVKNLIVTHDLHVIQESFFHIQLKIILGGMDVDNMTRGVA